MKFGHLCALTLAVGASQVEGHGYVYWPHSRQYLSNNSNMAAALSEMNGVKGMKTKWGIKKPPMTSDEQWAHDLCGNNEFDLKTDPKDSYDKWAGPPVATYKEGGKIAFTVVINAEHGGVHEFRLCPKQVSKKLGSLRENAECIDTHLIGRMCTPHEKCGCTKDRCSKYLPHSDPKDKIYSHGKPYYMTQGAHVMEFSLPKGVTCDQCTVQWYWHSAFGEPYKNCIDIKIEKDGTKTSRRRRRRSDRRRSPRRRATTTPKPPSTRRRRRACPETSSQSMAVQSADPHTPQLHGQKWADMEYEEHGCFALVEGDEVAKELAPTADTLLDFTCMKHEAGNGPCRSGLPFYRLLVHKEAATRLCFSFCSSKGLDLFGLLGGVECRCGATVLNQKVWKKSIPPPDSLILDHDNKLPKCDANSVKVYRYSGWMKYHNADGVQDDMLDLSKKDTNYMDSVIAGHHIKA